MSREIKFRVWDKLAERFTKCDEGYQGHYILSLKGEYHNLQNGSGGKEYVVQQWTGLTDTNGVDIYEGDILERIGDGSFCKIVISWDDANCAFYSKNSFNLHGKGSPISKHNINISDWTYWVVCGNIFENNELLKA